MRLNDSLPRSSSSSLIPAHVLQDRDSGISTEADSDADLGRLNPPKRYYSHPFSDDDEPLPAAHPQSFTEVNQALTSMSYHAHQGDQAILALKQLAREESWKKALKHKSGVVVYMLQPPKADRFDTKAPIFKGETVIHGFTPQSVFYVIGMRKLWDEKYVQFFRWRALAHR